MYSTAGMVVRERERVRETGRESLAEYSASSARALHGARRERRSALREIYGRGNYRYLIFEKFCFSIYLYPSVS